MFLVVSGVATGYQDTPSIPGMPTVPPLPPLPAEMSIPAGSVTHSLVSPLQNYDSSIPSVIPGVSSFAVPQSSIVTTPIELPGMPPITVSASLPQTPGFYTPMLQQQQQQQPNQLASSSNVIPPVSTTATAQ